MVGSSNSISCSNIMLNSAVADTLLHFADELEKATDLSSAIHELIKREFTKHKRIIFNGNGYGEEWISEAKERGLLNLITTPDALPYLIKEKNVEMFKRNNIYSKSEVEARYNIQLDNYSKTVLIEATTMIDMVKKDYLPAIQKYENSLVKEIKLKKDIGISSISKYETETIDELYTLTDSIYKVLLKLEKATIFVKELSGYEKAKYIGDNVKKLMEELRMYVDKAETITEGDLWPYPSYSTLLFSV
jgi:glutamine synthetase